MTRPLFEPFEDDSLDEDIDPAEVEPGISLAATVGAEEAGTRLDKWLSGALPDLSRTRIKALIEEGMVTADGATISDASFRVKSGQSFALVIPESIPAIPQPQPMDLDIVYEDEDLIVVNKPAGLVVHPAPGSPDCTLVNGLLHHCSSTLSGIGGVKRPGIVHRLDKETSGLIVAAKNDAAHNGLAVQFADHSITRAYRCVVWGVPAQKSGEIEGNIGRSPTNRKKMAIVNKGGKHALTRYRVLKMFGTSASQVECRLATGRTHQIRVHMTALGHPLVGDSTYGRVRSAQKLRDLAPAAREALIGFPRQALHAFLLGFIHPRTGEMLRFEKEEPNDLRQLVQKLENV
ncbi:RluA family pseudouridine synthase [Telmatospirillum sp. J64-1]|uniref:RluA family pseudouridine synthase n=1 Tax=Telmatospirillum sp. J64-1 TaxID=2502183 RepID=UPI00115F3A4F|nr:RluA family pseudouridine synthase [Telmatospirillum sp. J64-1]